MACPNVRRLIVALVAGAALLAAPAVAGAAPVASAPDSPYETRGEAPVVADIVAAEPGAYAYSVQDAQHGTVTELQPKADGTGATATFVAADGFTGPTSFTIRVADATDPGEHADVPVAVAVRTRGEVVTGPGGTQDTNNGFSTVDRPTFTFRAATGVGAGATVAPATFRCALDGAALSPCNSGTYQAPSPLAEGDHTFTMRAATNGGTNVDPAPPTIHFVVDTTFPALTIDAGPDSDGTPYRAAFTFTHDQDGGGTTETECRLLSAADPAPDWTGCSSPVAYPGLDPAGGSYDFQVRAIDPAGNVTTRTRGFDQQGTPAFATAGTTPLMGSFGLGDATSNSVVDGPSHGTLQGAVPLPDFAYTAADGFAGRDTIRVRTTDGNGDQVRDVPIDVHPTSAFTTTPAAATPLVRPTWTFASPVAGAAFACRLDSGDEQDWTACDAGTYTPSDDLAEGDHTLEVRATAAGLTQLVPISSTVTVDTTPPDVDITGDPGALSNDPTPAFSFASTDATATFECSVDAGPFAACASGDDLAPLADGTHTLDVRAKDPATNVTQTPAHHAWEIDAHGPVLALGGNPEGTQNGPGEGGTTNARKPLWYFTASDVGASESHDDHLVPASIRCAIDGGLPTTGTCLSPWQPSASLSDGQHTLHLLATDTAGNTTDHTESFTVDTVPPPVVLTDTPGSKAGASASFSFSSPDASASFQCSTTGTQPTGWAPCTSPVHLTDLTSGPRTFKVRAVDPAGNQSTTPATFSWTAKSEVPATTFTRTPAAQTTGNDSVFLFSSTQDPFVTFDCKLDDGPFAACASGYSAPDLAAGVHTLTVQGTNDVGAREAVGAVHTWTVTTPYVAPPQTVTQTRTETVERQTTATTTVPGPTTTVQETRSTTTYVCEAIPATRATSRSVLVQRGLSVGATVDRSIGRLGADRFALSVTTAGKGSTSARAKALAKAVSSIQVLQGSRVLATLKGSSRSVAVVPQVAGKATLTIKVNRRKGKALKTALTLTVLPTCPAR